MNEQIYAQYASSLSLSLRLSQLELPAHTTAVTSSTGAPRGRTRHATRHPCTMHAHRTTQHSPVECTAHAVPVCTRVTTGDAACARQAGTLSGPAATMAATPTSSHPWLRRRHAVTRHGMRRRRPGRGTCPDDPTRRGRSPPPHCTHQLLSGRMSLASCSSW
jgi:hypothetical protein